METDPYCFGTRFGNSSWLAHSLSIPIALLLPIGFDSTSGSRARWHSSHHVLRIDIRYEQRWKVIDPYKWFNRRSNSLLDISILLLPSNWIALCLLRYLVHLNAFLVRILISIARNVDDCSVAVLIENSYYQYGVNFRFDSPHGAMCYAKRKPVQSIERKCRSAVSTSIMSPALAS